MGTEILKLPLKEESGNKMNGNRFNIKYRIFKRERVRESKESTSIVPKQKSELAKNQLELSWDNTLLDESYVSIIGRVMLKEWERVLVDFPIYRAFFHTKNENEVKLFVTFNVTQDLEGDQIKQVVFTATDILNECLEKVTKKVLGESFFEEKQVTSVQAEPKVESPQIERPKSVAMKEYEYQLKEQDNVIRQLTLEIEHQESILKGLSSIKEIEAPTSSVTDQDIMAEMNELRGKLSSYETQFNLLKSREVNLIDINNQLADEKAKLNNTYQQKLQQLELVNEQQVKQVTVLEEEVKSLVRETQALTTKLNTNEEINVQLDKANLKLNDMLKQNKVDAKRMSHVAKLEQKIKDLEKEKSHFKVQFLDSQRLSQQFENTNRRLNESLERLQSSQTDLVGKAQEDYSALENTLEETEKNLKLEINERQKLEIQITKLNKTLAEEKLAAEAREKQLKKIENDILDFEDEKEISETAHKDLEDALEQKEMQVKNLKATNEILNDKLDKYEGQKAKWDYIDDWQEKYAILETKFNELDKEGYSYRQEINLLTSQISKLEVKLRDSHLEESTPVFAERLLNVSKAETLAKEIDDEEIYENELDDEYDYDYDYEYEYFTYEADPYVEDVVTEELMNIRKKDQVKDERKIKELLEASDGQTYHDVKISASEYKKYIIAFKFLSFRWDQVYIMDDADKNSAFLEWCVPYIEEVEDFQEDLSYDVKKSIFKKKYVTIDESAFNLLKGYAELSNYLDTYYLRVSYYIDKYFLNEGKN